MKKLLFTMSLALIALTASAIPAKRGNWRTVTLPDGTEVKLTLVGDEHGHFWQTADGKAYLYDETTKSYQQADKQQLLQKAQTRRAQANQRRQARMKAKRKVGSYGDYTGSKKGLIILVEYQDTVFKSGNTPELYHRIANEENFSHEKGFVGSVHDYFHDQSQGQFDLTFDVMGPVKLSQKQSYYGGNDSRGDDKHPEEMVVEACKAIQNEVNFKDYDWDNDGEVDQVFILYAGAGEANGGAANTVWPHEWQLSAAGKSLTLDGVRIDTYGCSCELQPDEVSAYGTVYSWKIDGLGTICHEFSHCLGYPDMYDTAYGGHYGMYSWDLMDMGSYNGSGFIPAGYTSYEKMEAGWQQPVELKGTMQIENMEPISDGGNTYIVYNKANQNEYFLLENRQKQGWDSELEGNGLLILHVDYDATVWANNMVNTVSSSYYGSNTHERCTIFKADNRDYNSSYSGRSSSDIAGDPYPYGTNNKLTNTSTPAAKLYNNNSDGTKYMNVDITDITRNSDGTISFNFSDGTGEASDKQEQTLDLTELPAMTYGAEPYTLPAKTNEGLSLTWKSSNQTVATISGNVLTIKKVGTSTITATQAGNSQYQALSKEYTLTVSKARLTVKADDKTMTEGDELPELTVSYTGFVNGEDVSVLTKQATASTTATSQSPAGTYTITVRGATATNYAMSYSNGKLTINPAEQAEKQQQTLDMPDELAMTYGDEAYSLPTTTNEGQRLTWTVSDKTVVNIRSYKLYIKGAGTATLTAKQAGNDQYEPFEKVITVNIAKAPLTIKADDYTITEGEAIPELTVSYEGFVEEEDSSVLLTLPTVTTTATADSKAGQYPITPAGAEAANYDITYVDGVLTIEEKQNPQPGDDEGLEFVKIGTAKYTEFCILNLGENEDGTPMSPVTYDVEIEESTTTPGIYRLLNPYGPAFPYFDAESWDETRSFNLVIHAENPDAVYIKKQAIGPDEDGLVYLESLGSYFMTHFNMDIDELFDMGCFGTLRQGVITFPAYGMVLSFGDGESTLVNRNGQTSIGLPGATATAIRSLDTTQPDFGKVFTLGGQRIDKRLAKKGVFISGGKKAVY